jgi:hypothetical protein
MKRVRALVFAIVALAPSGCGRACSCTEGEKVYEHVDGPVKVEFVRRTRWSGGRVPGRITTFVLRVGYEPPIELPVDCSAVDLAEDPTGQLVAWRCQEHADAAWSLLRLVGRRRWFLDCPADELGRRAKPDFSAARPVADVAPRIFSCSGHQMDATMMSWLVDEVRAQGGDDHVGAFFAATADAELPAAGPLDLWLTALRKLGPGERRAVEAATCPSLSDARANDCAYMRAARICPFESPSVGEAAIARLDAALADNVAKVRPCPITWPAIVAARTRGKDAGAKACAALARAPTPLAYTVIAATGTRCEAAARAECKDLVDCDGGPCGADEMARRARAWLAGAERDADGLRPFSASLPIEGARIAAALAQGPLPADAIARRARAHYAYDPGSPALPSCMRSGLDAGDPYHCEYRPSPWDLCALPMDAGTFDLMGCRLRIDDRARTIVNAGRVCVEVGAACRFEECCGSATCVRSRCEAPSTSPSASATP